MSRVGKKPIEVPAGVKLAIEHGTVRVEGSKGKLNFKLHPRVTAQLKDKTLTVEPASNMKTDRALQGTTRSCLNNMILGVTQGFQKELLIEGVGFKAALTGKQLNLALGFTHPVLFDVPEGITVEVPKPTHLIVKGFDKVLVGEFSAQIRREFPAEPYKGKGVRYAGEVVRRKAGKTVTK